LKERNFLYLGSYLISVEISFEDYNKMDKKEKSIEISESPKTNKGKIIEANKFKPQKKE